jgi:uncharacterized membrane-anchored protein YhcB (DUF1043 family)
VGTIGWLALIAVGIALGVGIGRAWPVRTAKMAELEREKDQARNELGQYREEVSAHFERTAELFDKVTADYRSLYEHLALSARQLGAIEGESTPQPLEKPEQRRLGAVATPETPDAPETSETPEASATPAATDAPPAPSAGRRDS